MGSGGGSSAGKVDYPMYMQSWHSTAINGALPLEPSTDEPLAVTLNDAMNYAMDGASPYVGVSLIDADDVLLGGGAAVITDFPAPFTHLVTYSNLDFDSLCGTYTNNGALADFVGSKETRIAAIIAAESALLDEDINTQTLPQFKAGLRDIGAVMSSAFAIGEANIWASKTKALAKTDAIIRWEAEKTQAELVCRLDEFALRKTIHLFEIKKTIAALAGDFAKVYATMHTELLDFALENEAKDKLWDVKVFQYGGNFLGSIAGSAVSTDRGDSRGAKMAGTMSGMLAAGGVGAAAGFMFGGPAGAALGGLIGAGVGGLAGYFGS